MTTNGGSTWVPLLRLSDARAIPPGHTRMQLHEPDLTPTNGRPLRTRFGRSGGTSDFFVFLASGWIRGGP
jgi:hypothetical protein